MRKITPFVICFLFLTSHHVLAQDQTPSTSSAMDSSVEPPPPEITESEKPSSPSKPEGESSPDVGEATADEARFARIYQKYNSREIGDEKWNEIAGDKESEAYSLQNGDNLWDISTKLFGNGFYGQKVWQLNDDITNPHLVEVGKTLKFTPGSSTTPPSLGVEADVNQNITDATTTSNDVDTPEFDTVVTQDAPEGNQVVIPPGKKSRPVLSRIPPSFREYNKTIGDYDRKTGFAKDGLKRAPAKVVPSSVSSIVVEDVWKSDGKIIEMEGDSTVAATYQNVVIKVKEPTQKGASFTVFSTNGKVTDPTTHYSIGVELETRAELEILEAVEGAGENVYRGMITYTDLPVRLGDSVKIGKLITRARFETHGPVSSVAARIVNGERNKRLILELHGVVFLDKGAEDGLNSGDILHVLKNISTRNPDTVIPFDSKPIGLLKVVEVEPHVSTAVIVGERDAIKPGDMTQVIPPDTSENSDSTDNLHPEDKVMEDHGD
jgi:hypothetical protein